MAMGEPSLGLCSTCNNRSICTQRKGIRFPVLFCEEFDDSAPASPKRQGPPAPAEKQAPLDTAMGLCCNCGHRDSCTLPRAPGGVWHCEEYC